MSHSYDCMKPLTSASGMSFSWDGNGNMEYMHDGSDAWDYAYDPEDRLERMEKNGVLYGKYARG